MEKKQTTLPELFLSFARIGLFTFGGGLAMLPMLEREVVTKHSWVTEDEMMDYYAIGQCTPGIIAVNTATFIGRKERGIAGGIVATFGVVFPSVVIITIIAAVLQNFAELAAVQNAFLGIRACVAAQILNTLLRLLKKNVKDWLTLAICVVCFIAILLFGVSPIPCVIGAGICGLAFGEQKSWADRKKENAEAKSKSGDKQEQKEEAK